MYDPKTSTFVRKPVGMKDTNKVMVDMVDKRLLLRKQPKEAQSQEAVGDILKNLAKEFEAMAKKRMREVTQTQEPSGGTEPVTQSTDPQL